MTRDADPDFRDAALAESLVMLDRATPGSARSSDPLKGGFSFCLPAPGDGRAFLRRTKWAMVGSLVLGFAGLLAGGAAAFAQDRGHDKAGRAHRADPDAPPSALLIGGLACSAGGIALMLGGVLVQRRTVRRRVLRNRFTGLHDAGGPGAGPTPLVVEVENAATKDKLKGVSEDLGLLLPEPALGRLRIEGVRYRYAIYAADVTDLAVQTGGTNVGVTIRYRVGRTELALWITHQSLWAEAKRQLFGSASSPVVKRVFEVFGPPPPQNWGEHRPAR